jgi:hypothetical protein
MSRGRHELKINLKNPIPRSSLTGRGGNDGGEDCAGALLWSSSAATCTGRGGGCQPYLRRGQKERKGGGNRGSPTSPRAGRTEVIRSSCAAEIGEGRGLTALIAAGGGGARGGASPLAQTASSGGWQASSGAAALWRATRQGSRETAGGPAQSAQ